MNRCVHIGHRLTRPANGAPSALRILAGGARTAFVRAAAAGGVRSRTTSQPLREECSWTA